MEITVSGVELECIQGNIVRQDDCDAIVNAANARLRTGGGVAGAIHRAAGPGLAEEGKPLAPIHPGEAVITGAHNLPNEYVIHCLGPVYGRDKPGDRLLGDCYRNALDLAGENGIKKIAFPAISTGAFGFPVKEAAEVSWKSVLDKLGDQGHLEVIRFVLFDSETERTYARALQELTGRN